MKLTEEQKTKLNAQLNEKHVKTRAQAGTTLSYVDGHYVITMLNDLFGSCGWSTSIDELRVVHDSKDEASGRYRVGYVCMLHLRIDPPIPSDDEKASRFGYDGFSTEDVGAGTQIDKDCGKAHEGAAKEAVTDALKRCARQLGNAMGLALYDKEQRGVGDQAQEVAHQEELLQHGAQKGKPAEVFSVAWLNKYLAVYAEEISPSHREDILDLIKDKKVIRER